MGKKKATDYWKEEQETLIKNYVNATDERERNNYLKEVTGKVNTILDIILLKYFGYNGIDPHKKDTIKRDCFNHTMLKTLKYFNPDRGRAYSFIGMVSKRFFYDELIKSKGVLKNNHSYLDEVSYDEPSAEYRNKKENFDHLKTTAIDKLIDEKKLIKKDIDSKYYKGRIIFYNHLYIDMINDLIEYINTNEFYSIEGMFRLLKDKYEEEEWYTPSTIQYFLKKIGFSKYIHSVMKTLNGRHDNKKVDDPYQEFYEYDDYVPSDDKQRLRKKLKEMYHIT